MNRLFPDLPAVPTAEEGSDVAYTPAACAAACVRYLADNGGIPCPYWEPFAGGGAWIDPLDTIGPGFASELDPHAASIGIGAHVWDAAKGPRPSWMPIRSVVTNPPFTCAASMLRRFLQIEGVDLVCFLVLQAWIVAPGKEQEQRLDLIWGPTARPVEQVVLYPRIAFEGPGRSGTTTDMREYCLLIWRRQPDGSWLAPVTTLHRLDWRSGVVQ